MALFSKQGSAERLLSLVLILSGSATYDWLAIRGYRAQRLADRSDQASLERAVALEPQNAEYHDLLCRNLIFVTEQTSRATGECMKASELNPYSSTYWLDLAQAYLSSGDNIRSSVAVHKAVAVDPTTPDTAWSAANFLLIQGDLPAALHQFSIALRGDPGLAAPILNTCWQSLHDTTLIQGILPPKPDIYLSLIELLLAKGEPAAAHQIWLALMQLKPPFDYHQALFYVDNLLQAKDADGAEKTWEQLASKSKTLQAYLRPGDLIVDGSFTQEILNSGFDWRYTPRPHVALTLDTNEVHSDGRSLLLTYSESGGDSGLFEYVVVQPNTRYQLTAWVKSQELLTANGPRLTLSDAFDNKLVASTDETAGSTPWHHLDTEFRTGPVTKLLILSISRVPADTRIQGQFWVDDISLRPM